MQETGRRIQHTGSAPQTRASRLRELWNRTGPFALSAICHLTVLLVFVHLVAVSYQEDEHASLQVSLVTLLQPAEGTGEPQEEPHETQAEPEPEPEPAPPVPASDMPAVQPEEPSQRPPGQLVMSAGTGGHAGDLFGHRAGSERWSALVRGGGGVETESAVHAALRFLARYQSPDGSWDPARFASQAGVVVGKNQLGAGHDDPTLSPGITSLALLAFLGAGNTHKDGEFQQTVARGLRYLRRLQQSDGRFTARLTPGPDTYLMYHQALCTLVISEACAMTGDGSLKPHIERSIQFMARAQQSGGGWDYGPEMTGRNDTSVTGWVVMAMKSAHAAGVPIPDLMTYNVMRHFESCTLDNGEVVYSDRNTGVGRRGLAMLAVGMVCRQFLGWPLDSKILQCQARIISQYPIDWARLRGQEADRLLDSSYYWYYGTLAQFQMGGQFWPAWNAAMKRELLANQVKDGPMRGSWDPVGLWANAGGRIYSTALNALNLEVYYRYLPLYESEPLDGPGVLARTTRSTNAAQRLAALRMLRDFTQPAAVAALADALTSTSEEVVLTAALALAWRHSRLAIPALIRLLQSQNGFIRYQALQALAGYDLVALAPRFVELLDDPERHVRVAAARQLERWSNNSFGYDPDSEPEVRRTAINQFHLWWENTARLRPDLPDSRVIATDAERGLAFVSAGENHHVAPGSLLAVFREGKFVALLSAQEVFADRCVATLLREFSSGTAHAGDEVIPETAAPSTGG